MRWLCNLLVALSIPAIGVAGTSFQVAIDGEPLAKADVYLYANPDQRTWIAAVADGVADLPDDAVGNALQGASGDWRWVITTADELVYASPLQTAGQRDWRAALATMGGPSSNKDLIDLPAPIELSVGIARADGRAAGHAYGSIARVFDEGGPCGQTRTLAPQPPGASADDVGRIGWRLAPGRYLLQSEGETRVIEVDDRKDANRLVSIRFALTEHRTIRLHALAADGRDASGVLLGRFIGDCMVENFATSDADGRVSAVVGENELAGLRLSGSNPDGTQRRQSLEASAAEAWRSGTVQSVTWYGHAPTVVALPTPTLAVEAALPNLLVVRFDPARCTTGDDAIACRYEFCRAGASATCLPLIGPDTKGRRWVRMPTATDMIWTARSVPDGDPRRWRASPWTPPVELRLPIASARPPHAPDSCRAEAMSPYALSMHWHDRSDDEYGFELTACLADEPSTCRRMALADRDETLLSLHGMPSATTLNLHVRAFNAAGSSPECSTTVSMPADAELQSDIAAWTARYGNQPSAATDEVDDVEALSTDSNVADALPFTTECTHRAALLSAIYPRYLPQGQRQIDGQQVELFSIDDTDAFCPRGACGIQAFGSTSDRPDCYRWLGEVVQIAPPASTPPRPAIGIDLSEARERVRWFRNDNGAEVDRLDLCGNDGDLPASDLAPPYQLDRYGRPIACQLRPWQWPDDMEP